MSLVYTHLALLWQHVPTSFKNKISSLKVYNKVCLIDELMLDRLLYMFSFF